MEKNPVINIEVVYATAESAAVIPLCLPAGSSAGEAIAASGLLLRFPEIQAQTNPIGIFSRRVSWDTVLQDGDRVEIYRPLYADPRIARQARVKQEKKSKLLRAMNLDERIALKIQD